MSATPISFNPHCTGCGAKLTLEEMHYYESPDHPGTATCEACEGKWMEEVDAWKRGERDEFPYR
jgi:hypothetical protein